MNKVYPRIFVGCKTENGVSRSYLDNSIINYDDEELDDINNHKESPYLPEALNVITEEWIENGNYCEQTILDMSDALKWFMEREDE